jgi:hypothetical protein
VVLARRSRNGWSIWEQQEVGRGCGENTLFDVFGSDLGQQATHEKVTVKSSSIPTRSFLMSNGEKDGAMKMNRHDLGRSAKGLLIPLATGAVIACGSMIPILIGEGPDLPVYC